MRIDDLLKVLRDIRKNYGNTRVKAVLNNNEDVDLLITTGFQVKLGQQVEIFGEEDRELITIIEVIPSESS